jgi:hypothetical protein
MPIPGWEDWDLWLGAIERGWFLEALPIVGFEYRVRPDSMVATFGEAGSRRQVLEHVVEKHRELFERHVLGVVFTGQSIAHDSAQLIRRLEAAAQGALAERDLFRNRYESVSSELTEARTLLADAAAAREQATVERDRIMVQHKEDAAALRSTTLRLAALEAELERLRQERLQREEQVRFMESTRAWRLRSRLVALKTALRQRLALRERSGA